MSTINRTTVADLRGAARLAFDATLGITTLVEKMHHTIQLVHPPLGASRAESTRGLTGLIYRTIRGTTRVIGKGLDAGLTPVAAFLPEGESTAGRNALASAINGVYGDHLERTVIHSRSRCAGARGRPRRSQRPGDVVHDASGKVLLAIHGLCLNEQHWARDGHHRIADAAEATGHTLVQLRYNSGRSIDTNGRSLAVMLEVLFERWPVPVTQLVIVGHSMGGLVARSAIHHGTVAGHSWRALVRKLFSLGTPHHGAPLERGGNRLDYVMELSPYVAPFTAWASPAAQITDLRYGSITAVEQEFVPLPVDVECYALAATLGKRRGLVADRLIGDGLVPLDSALGRHPDAGRTLAIPKSRQWIGYEMGHLELLGRPEVYSQLEQWLR